MIQKSLEYFLKYKDTFLNQDCTYGMNLKEGEQYGGVSGYEGLFNLVTMDFQTPIPKRQFRAFAAPFFVKCLEKTNYFASTTDYTNDMFYMGED